LAEPWPINGPTLEAQKCKQANHAQFCKEDVTGMDLNRNFPFQWGGLGSSSDYSNRDYRGNSPASKPETQALLFNYALSIFPTLQRQTDVTNPNTNTNTNYPTEKTSGIFIDVHSYGELIIRASNPFVRCLLRMWLIVDVECLLNVMLRPSQKGYVLAC
jgi:hypothetical protein